MNNKVFINKNFLALWFGKVISQLGDKFYAIALAWWVLQKTNSPGIMGFFLLISVLPGLIFGFFAGAAISFVTAFFDPAIQAIIPQVVPKERLNEANSMSQMVNGICTVLGLFLDRCLEQLLLAGLD